MSTRQASKPHRTCEIEGCDRPYRTRGMCQRHYDKWRYHNTVRGDQQRTRSRRRYAERGEEIRAYNREYARKEENKARARERQFMRTYGITTADYERMREEQQGRCAICGADEKKLTKGLHVDHCHDSGRVRGLLCCGCNRGIGFLNESPEKLRAALRYLGHEE